MKWTLTLPDRSGLLSETPAIDLLDVPAASAARGFHSFDLSVYHLPSIDSSYLAELRAAFADAKSGRCFNC